MRDTICERLPWQIYDSIPLINCEQSQKMFVEPVCAWKSLAKTNLMRSNALDHVAHTFILFNIKICVTGAGRSTGRVVWQLEDNLVITFLLGMKPYVQGPLCVVREARPNIRFDGDSTFSVRIDLERPVLLPKAVTVSPDVYVILDGQLTRPI